ncbi:MAG: Gfo/Idh/MocA family oxidoreductase [Pseudomonadota bacterium]
MFGVGIIGCGLIGSRRAASLGDGGRVVACADVDIQRAQTLAERHGAIALNNWQSLVARSDVDIVIVATRHDSLAHITLAAIKAGKHVLVEKPAARSVTELAPVLALAKSSTVRVRVGFNHRYHRAIRKAREIVASGALGELMYLRARYGHGGRLGYEKEWRADPILSGGGELIDQGPHLIDLARCFLGEFTKVQGFAHTYYWDMPVEDNGFLLLRTDSDQVAFLHASCTEWKNLFSLEIYGRAGKLDIAGLGGSYGVERITWYRMTPEMGPPETTAWEYPMSDDSWAVEMAEFYEDIRIGREPQATLSDAAACLSIIERIYKESGFDHHA